MDTKEVLEVQVAKITSLTDERFDYFFPVLKKQSFKKGRPVIVNGDIVDCEYFVIPDCLKSFFINNDFKMLILQFPMQTWRDFDYCVLYKHGNSL